MLIGKVESDSIAARHVQAPSRRGFDGGYTIPRSCAKHTRPKPAPFFFTRAVLPCAV
jgi:hypothetical protein